MASEGPSADESLGRLLSWVTGKRKVENADSPTDRAVGELVSWVAGKKKK